MVIDSSAYRVFKLAPGETKGVPENEDEIVFSNTKNGIIWKGNTPQASFTDKNDAIKRCLDQLWETAGVGLSLSRNIKNGLLGFHKTFIFSPHHQAFKLLGHKQPDGMKKCRYIVFKKDHSDEAASQEARNCLFDLLSGRQED